MNHLKYQELRRTLKTGGMCDDAACFFISHKDREVLLCNFIYSWSFSCTISRTSSRNGFQSIERCLLKQVCELVIQ